MALTGASRAELTEVEVVLYQRDHSFQQEPLLTVIQHIRLHANRAQHDIHPFFFGKCLSALLQLIDVHMGHLDRSELSDLDGISVFLILLNILIVQLKDAPDAAAEQPVELLRIFICDRDILQAEVGELRHVDIPLNIQIYRNFINDGITATGTEYRQNLLGLIRAHKIIRENPLHILDTLFDDFLIIRAAVLSQQKLKDIHRHICTFLNLLCQILPDNLPEEVLAQLVLNNVTSIIISFIALHHWSP